MGVCCMDYVDIAPLQMSGWWCDFGWSTVTSWTLSMSRMVVFVRACRHDEQGREYLKRARNLHRGGSEGCSFDTRRSQSKWYLYRNITAMIVSGPSLTGWTSVDMVLVDVVADLSPDVMPPAKPWRLSEAYRKLAIVHRLISSREINV